MTNRKYWGLFAIMTLAIASGACVVGDTETEPGLDELVEQDWPEGVPATNPDDEPNLTPLDEEAVLQYATAGCTQGASGWVTYYGDPFYLAVLYGGQTQCQAKCYQIRNQIRVSKKSNAWNAAMNFYPLKQKGPDQTNCYISKP